MAETPLPPAVEQAICNVYAASGNAVRLHVLTAIAEGREPKRSSSGFTGSVMQADADLRLAITKMRSDDAARVWNEAVEAAARLHDSVDPWCEHQREGADAMRAIIQYRDKIRALRRGGP